MSGEEEIDLWDRETVLRFFGGIHVATLYRGVRHKDLSEADQCCPQRGALAACGMPRGAAAHDRRARQQAGNAARPAARDGATRHGRAQAQAQACRSQEAGHLANRSRPMRRLESANANCAPGCSATASPSASHQPAADTFNQPARWQDDHRIVDAELPYWLKPPDSTFECLPEVYLAAVSWVAVPAKWLALLMFVARRSSAPLDLEF
jgi:hypothetical protein